MVLFIPSPSKHKVGAALSTLTFKGKLEREATTVDHNQVLLEVLLLWLIPKLTWLLAIKGPLYLCILHTLLVVFSEDSTFWFGQPHAQATYCV